MPEKISREVLKDFRDEVRGYLPLVRAALDAFRHDSTCREELANARRQVHIIKGAASMVGMAPLSHVAYEIEQILEMLENTTLVLNGDLTGLLHAALNDIDTCIESAEHPGSAVFPGFDTLITSLRTVSGSPQATDTRPPDTHSRTAKPDSTPPPPESSLPAAAAERTDARSLQSKKIPRELLEVFMHEAEDHFHTIRSLLEQVSRDTDNTTQIQDLQRTVHTLKGSAGAVGFAQLAELSHRMEDLLDALHDGTRILDDPVQQLLTASADLLEDIAGENASPAVLDDVYQRFAAILPTPAPETLESAERRSGQPDRRTDARPPGGVIAADDLVRISQERIDELIKAVGELVINRTALEQHLGSLTGRMEGLAEVVDRLRLIAGRLETEYELAGRSHLVGEPSTGERNIPDFDELELDRYTEFHHLLRQLSEAASDVKTFKQEITALMDECVTASTAQGRLTGDIQEKLMEVRMVPLASIANRLRQIVRVVSRAQNKQVDLIIEGEHIEIDKKVLDEMVDPLMHVLRNDVAHGIESPEERRAIGKNTRGLIRLRAYHEGSKIIIAISDDGAGLQLERIREIAVRKSFVSAEEGRALSDEDLFQMIFHANFSTAEHISEVSGRGVGMDVVKQQVNKLQGSLMLESSPGRGTLLTIRLPMSLSIRRALLVKAWSESYAIPLGSLKHIFRFPAGEIPAANTPQKITHENETYEYIHLGRFMGSTPHEEQARGEYVPVLVVDAGARFVALQVDAILGEREVVVKNLGPMLQRVPGVSGATVLGDGNVMLIVNPLDIGLPGESVPFKPPTVVRTVTARDREQLTVLIVDDSVSVRQVVSGLVESSGWKAFTASDGLDALDTLQGLERKPDIIILDVEMPRMDGYELLSRLKSRDLWRHIPVVMLTSRAGEKHRLRALELGAAEYIVKPYQDETMRSTIRHLVSQPRSG